MNASRSGVKVSSQFFNPFPIRCVIEVGTANAVSAVIARIDTNHNAVREMLFRTQLPIGLRYRNDPPRLEDQSVHDVEGKIRTVMAAAQRLRPIEYAGLVTPPLSEVNGIDEMMHRWTKLFEIRFRTFDEDVPHSLVAAAAAKSQPLNHLAFEAAAAAAQCTNPDNFLFITEHDAADNSSLEIVGRDANTGDLQTYRFPLSAANVHRMLCLDIQKRDPRKYSINMSPNPSSRKELSHLRSVVTDMFRNDVAPWVLEKSRGGCAIASASTNGGTMNIAARIAGQVRLSNEKLIHTTDFHLCALTDVLLSENYPYPSMVLPQAVTASAVMNVIGAHQVNYLPEVALAHAALVDPTFWLQGRAASMREALADEPNMALGALLTEPPDRRGMSRSRIAPGMGMKVDRGVQETREKYQR